MLVHEEGGFAPPLVLNGEIQGVVIPMLICLAALVVSCQSSCSLEGCMFKKIKNKNSQKLLNP